MEKQNSNINVEIMNAKVLNINYLNKYDLEVCDYVSKQLSCDSERTVDYGNSISLDMLIESSMNEISIFGEDSYLRVCEMLLDAPINRVFKFNDMFETSIGYEIDDVTGKIIVDSGVVTGYDVPRKLYELSIYCFAHEHIHSLKDTNYDEYRNAFVFGEVLPIFYEFMIYNSKDKLKKEVIKLRMNDLIGNRMDYLKNNNFNLGDRELNEQDYLRTRYGNYLNSFYYAMILYSVYSEKPVEILNYVKKVLNHEMTTLEMLKSLDIYGDIQGKKFEKELKKVRKIIK